MIFSLKPIPRWLTTLARSMMGLIVLALHIEFLSDESWTRWAVVTLPLVILPAVLGSYLNLKGHGRWVTYYVIWYQLATSPLKHYIPVTDYDMFLFLTIDGTYTRHLRTLVGGKPIPLRVYFSSWISDDSKLSAIIAAHKTLDPNNNNDDKRHDGHSEQQQTATQMTTKTKWVYALVIGALVLNTYLVISRKYWSYNCFCMRNTFDTFTTDEEYEEYNSYCLPSSWHLVYRSTFPGWPRPESLFAIVTANLCAAAWSTLPTKIVIRAWIRMWSNNSSNDGRGDRRRNKLFAFRKIHYSLFLCLLKAPAYDLIEHISIPSWDDLDILNWERDLFLWAVVFYNVSSLIFALVLLWNLYVVHSGLDTCQDQQQLLLQGDGFECQEKVGGRSDAAGISESEKKPLLDGEAPSVHVVDMSSVDNHS